MVLAIDKSGSLCCEKDHGTDPDGLRYEALKLFLGLLTESGNNVGTVVFDEQIRYEAEPSLLEGMEAKEALIGELAKYYPCDDTDIGKAMLRATEMLRSMKAENDLPCMIVLFSDGMTDFTTGDVHTRFRESWEKADRALTAAREEGITINGILLNVADAAEDGRVEMQLYTSETKGKYTVGDVPQDYTKLRLNELNGNDKFIEIYNAGDQKIKLQGVYIQKDEGLNWTGDNRVLDPGAYLLLYSEDVIATDHPDWDKGLIFNSGLSAKKNVRIQLFDPSGNSIDDFNIVKHPGGTVKGSYGRNKDGKWYIQTTATPGAVNVDGSDSIEAWF